MADITQRPVQPVPNHRDLYLLIAGVVVGILVGPAILGRVASDTYQRLFVGQAPDLQAQVELIERLRATGVTETAVNEQLDKLRRNTADAQREHLARLQGLTTAVVLVLAALMMVEPLVQPEAVQARAGLATARYALIAVWLALILARPALLRHISLSFVVLLLIIALLAALLPLRKTTT